MARVPHGHHIEQLALIVSATSINPIAEWRDGRVVLVPPEQIEDQLPAIAFDSHGVVLARAY